MTMRDVIDWTVVALIAGSIAGFAGLMVLAWRERPAGRGHDGRRR